MSSLAHGSHLHQAPNRLSIAALNHPTEAIRDRGRVRARARRLPLSTTYAFALASAIALAFVLLSLPLGVNGIRYRMIVRQFNNKNTYFLYDADADPAARRVMHTYTNNSKVFLVEVANANGSVAGSAVGQLVTTSEFLTGPRGCFEDIETSNCVASSVQAANNFIAINAMWYLSPRSDECLLGGGDEYSCLGPMLLWLDSTTKTFDFDAQDLLYARGTYIKSNIGPYCSIPTIVEVDTVRPSLVVTTNCSDYAGFYLLDGTDAYTGFLTNVTYTFSKSDFFRIYHRVLVVRVPRTNVTNLDAPGDAWSVRFADAAGVGDGVGFYVPFAASTLTIPTPRIPMNSSIQFLLNAGGSVNACYATFTVDTTNVYPPKLHPPERLSEINYHLNKMSPRFYTSRPCGYAIGGYTVDLKLSIPGCLDGQECFGEPMFSTGEFPRIPLMIPPNHAFDAYVDDCVSFYPFGPSFPGFGTTGTNGPTLQRTIVDQSLCFAPYYNIQTILSATSPDEKYRQCRMMMGEVSGRTGDACRRRISVAFCKPGWLAFRDRCYYKYDVNKERWAFASRTEATRICASIDPELGSKVEPVVYADPVDLGPWWDQVMTFYKRAPVQGFPYCFAVPGTSRCDCRDIVLNSPNDPLDDAWSVTPCSCTKACFIPCSYAMKDKEIEGRFVSLSPRTVKILRDGQMGSPWTGHEVQCRCFNGFARTPTGDCFGITCPLATTAVSDNPLTIMSQKCYAFGHGVCADGDPRYCLCVAGYTPPSSFLPSHFDDAKAFPCACPGGEAPDEELGSINGLDYARSLFVGVTKSGEPVRLPCGGKTRGACVVDSFSNLGVCACAQRVRISNDQFAGEMEAASTGKGCGCRTPRLYSTPYIVSDIVQNHCNGRGTCCPFGETVHDPSGETGTSVCADASTFGYGAPAPRPTSTAEFVGCACDDSVDGQSCTCASLSDLVRVRGVTSVTTTKIVVDLGAPLRVSVIETVRKRTLIAASLSQSAAVCSPISVGLGVSPVVADIDCPLATHSPHPRGDIPHLHWLCPTRAPSNPAAYRRYIIVAVSNITRNCRIRAFQKWAPPAGVNGNPYAARLSQNTLNRGALHYLQTQPLRFAAFGCTDSRDMCDPNHAGVGCGIGVSAVVRLPTADGTAGAKVNMVCGETTLRARGKPDPISGTCKCNSITTDLGGIYGPVAASFAPDPAATDPRDMWDACECATINGLTCNGHGKCVRASFPYGTCSGDYLNYSRDALFTPFVSKSYPPEDKLFVIRAGSIFTLLQGVNESFQTLADVQAHIPNVYGGLNGTSHFSTCGTSTKYVAPTIDFFLGLPSLQRVQFSTTIWSLINNCSIACPCDGNGDLLTNHVSSCIYTNVTTGVLLGSIYHAGYERCRPAWISGIDKTFFNVTANDRALDAARTCVKSSVVVPLTDVPYSPSAPGVTNLTRIVFECVTADSLQTTNSSIGAARSAAFYGQLFCNNVIHRLIDAALRLTLGSDYVEQCSNEPITLFSGELGAFFGLFRDSLPGLSYRVPLSQWTNDHYAMIARVLDDNIYYSFDPVTGRDEIVDVLSERALSDYLASWVSSLVANGTTVGQFTDYVSLNKIRPAAAVDSDLLLALFDAFTAIPGLVYDFLDERVTRYTLSDTQPDKPDTPLTVYRLQNDTSNSSRNLFNFGRNWTSFYRIPGLTYVLPGTLRSPTIYNQQNFSSNVDAVRITFPVDLDLMQIYRRDNTICATILGPRAGSVVDVTCGGDPFQLNEQYFAFTRAYDAEVTARYNASDQALNTTIAFITEIIATEGSRGMGVKTVPSGMYATSRSADTAWTHAATYGSHDFGVNMSIDTGLLYFSEWKDQFGVFNNTGGNTSAIGVGLQSWFGLEFSRGDVAALTANLTETILTTRQLPFNLPLRAAVAALLASGQLTRAVPVNLSDPDHLRHLRDVHAVYLAAPRTGLAMECASNQRGVDSIPDSTFYRQWRGGAGEDAGNHQYGDEGGCACDSVFELGYREPESFCVACVAGYGTDPGMVGTWLGDSCRFPFAYGEICGLLGGNTGSVVVTQSGNLTMVVRGYRNAVGETTVARCLSIFVTTVTLPLGIELFGTNDFTDASVQSWRTTDKSTVATAFGDMLYWNGTVETNAGVTSVTCKNDFAISDTFAIASNFEFVALSRFVLMVLGAG